MHQFWFRAMLALVLGICSASFSLAEENAYTLDAVVVTADKESAPFQTGDVDKEQSPAFITTITRDQFEGKIENLSDIIKKESGIQIRQSGGMGSFSEMSIRGSSSDQVMIFMDGVLLNDASGGGVDLSNISLADVEAIEIYRGVTPINFGKSSIGGVVNIKTLRSRKGIKAGATLGYGSFDTWRLGGFLNHKPGKWDYLLSADYLASKNDFKFFNDKGTIYNPDDDEVERRHNAGFQQANILAKGGYDLSDTLRIALTNQYFEKDQEIPDWRNNETTETTLDTKRNITTMTLTADDMTPLHLNSALKFSYSWKEEEYNDSLGQIGLGRQHDLNTTRRFGVNLFSEWLTDFNSLSLMLDYQYETYSPEDLLFGRTPNESTRNMFNAGLQDSLILLSESLIITPAIRWTYIDDTLDSAQSSYAGVEGRTRNDSYFSPQIGAKYRPLDWLVLKTNFSKYIREPSFFELFGDRGLFTGNEDLKEEKGTNFDIGLELNFTGDEDLFKRCSFSLVYFQNKVDDLITRSFDSRGVGKSVNISESEIDGFEAGLQADFMKYFRLMANATWQDTENKSEIKAFNGKKLPGRWETAYFTRLEALVKGVKLHIEYLAEKDMFYDTANLLEAKNKEIVNTGISYNYDEWTISLEGKNITDRQYEDFNGFPMPGEAYYITLKYKL